MRDAFPIPPSANINQRGLVAWNESVKPPDGIDVFTPLTVPAVYGEQVEVSLEDGRVCTLSACLIDVGSRHYLPGIGTVRESHAQAIMDLEKKVLEPSLPLKGNRRLFYALMRARKWRDLPWLRVANGTLG